MDHGGVASERRFVVLRVDGGAPEGSSCGCVKADGEVATQAITCAHHPGWWAPLYCRLVILASCVGRRLSRTAFPSQDSRLAQRYFYVSKPVAR